MAVTAVMGGSALVGAGASIFGASKQASAAKQASNQQMQMYQQTRQDLLPYMNTGSAAFGQLSNLLGLGPQGNAGMLDTLRQSPGYQWAFDQGLQGVDRSAASKGLLLSGGQLKDVNAYGQGMADNLYGTYATQLQTAANTGANAAGGVGTAGGTAATQSGNAIMGGADAIAGGVGNAAQTLFGAGGGVQQAMTAYNTQNSSPLPGWNMNPATQGSFNSFLAAGG